MHRKFEPKKIAENPYFSIRVNDFKKTEAESKKSLIKDFSLFAATKDAPCYGGTALGPYYKKSKKGFKLHYLTKHNLDEYFGLEIMLRLGIQTPKARIVQRKMEGGKTENYIATRGIVDYIPMLAVRHDKEVMKDVGISKLKQRYHLDIEKQVIYDAEEKQEYKISGNLFGADVAGILIKDDDFQSDRFNLGLIRNGKRFYACAIDKDRAQFTGENFDKLSEDNSEITTDALFNSGKTVDQTLAVVYEIEQALKINGEDKQCDFDRIFLNPRVCNTPLIAEDAKEKCDNFKKSAVSAINFYKKTLGENCLQQFSEREMERKKIADAVLENFSLTENQESLRRIIVEDLRGPYYKNINNENLMDVIQQDIKQEFNLTPISKSKSRRKM